MLSIRRLVETKNKVFNSFYVAAATSCFFCPLEAQNPYSPLTARFKDTDHPELGDLYSKSFDIFKCLTVKVTQYFRKQQRDEQEREKRKLCEALYKVF